MHDDWRPFLHQPGRAEHAVHVYDDAPALAESLATYVAAGLACGEAAVVLATEENRRALVEGLRARGHDVDEAIGSGLLTLADADETLALLLADGTPEPRWFDRVVGGLVDGAAARSGHGPVRVYGELVQVLCQRGQHAGALLLEGLWNEFLRGGRNLSLLCGYRRADVDPALAEVCALHSRVHAAA